VVSLGIHLARVMLPFEAHVSGNTFATKFLRVGIVGIIRDSPERCHAFVRGPPTMVAFATIFPIVGIVVAFETQPAEHVLPWRPTCQGSSPHLDPIIWATCCGRGLPIREFLSTAAQNVMGDRVVAHPEVCA
jgi:hypothetical protein